MTEQEIRAAALDAASRTAQAIAAMGRVTVGEVYLYVLEIADAYTLFVSSGASLPEEPGPALVPNAEEVTHASLRGPDEDAWSGPTPPETGESTILNRAPLV